jgi:hypothetical protein
MSTIKLPATGEDLAYATREFVGQAYEQVREELEFKYLPQALLAIWAHSPLFKEARKTRPEPIGEMREICHIIVTFPGLAAIERIRDLLIQSNLVTRSDDQLERANTLASELFELTMRYARVQNLARHLRTAVNSHLRVLAIETSRDRSRGTSQYEASFFRNDPDELTRDRVFALRAAKLKTERDVDDWADDVNNLLSVVSSRGIMTSSKLKSATGSGSGSIAAGALNTYKLRFKQALATTLGIDLASPDVRIEKTSNKSIENLLADLAEYPKEPAALYNMLSTLRPKRPSRTEARMSLENYDGRIPGSGSSSKNLMKHVLNLGGRELVIEGSRGGFTSEMALGLIKTVTMQLTIEPDAPELVATFESGGQLLRVRIQDPKKSDRSKLSEVLMQLVS